MPEIELLQPHTHAGVAYAAGARLTVTDRQAAWLIDLGVATAVIVAAPERAGGETPPLLAEPEGAGPSRPAGGETPPLPPSRGHRGLKAAPTTAPTTDPNS